MRKFERVPVEQIETRYLHDFLAYVFRRIPKDTTSLLDVGTGPGQIGAVTSFMLGFKPDGIERWTPYADEARKFYSSLLQGDALETLQQMADKQYDVVTCFEVLEHMETQEKALKVLDEMERVGKMVVCSSPNREYFKPDADGNPWQRHRCFVPAKIMRKRGYTVRGAGLGVFYGGHLFRVFLTRFNEGWLAWKPGASSQGDKKSG
ncbi:MAG: methyltransferase domain-containing protein [Bacteroidota bacterium]